MVFLEAEVEPEIFDRAFLTSHIVAHRVPSTPGVTHPVTTRGRPIWQPLFGRFELETQKGFLPKSPTGGGRLSLHRHS